MLFDSSLCGRRLATFGLLLGALAAAPAYADITINSQTFTLGPTETVSAPFTSQDNVTLNSYSGLVLLDVTGDGNGANGGGKNDTFYFEPYGNGLSAVGCGALRADTVIISGYCAGQKPTDYMVYSLDDNHFVSFAGGSYLPNERLDHHYQFVISVDSLLALHGQVGPQQLHLGASDGNFGDNGGAFTINVTQLNQISATPEPSTAAIFAAGGALLLLRMRRRATRN